MLDALREDRWMIGIRAVAAMIFGVIALFLPGLTLSALVLLFGIYVLIDGVLTMASAWRNRNANGNGRWWLGLFEGIIGIIAGVLTLFWPGITGLVLLYLIAFWAVMTGIMEIAAALELRRQIENEWSLGLMGVLSIIAGILLFLSPVSGALAISWLIGIYAILFGAALMVLFFRLGNLEEKVSTMS